MPEPLMVLKGRGFRPKTLFIFDDHMVYENRGLIQKDEATIPYSQVAQVNLHKALASASLTLVNTGGAADITLDNLWKNAAEQAKELIQQKVRGAQANPTQGPAS
jgi:hypothetical protein